MVKRHAHGTELFYYDVPVGPMPTAPLWDCLLVCFTLEFQAADRTPEAPLHLGGSAQQLARHNGPGFRPLAGSRREMHIFVSFHLDRKVHLAEDAVMVEQTPRSMFHRSPCGCWVSHHSKPSTASKTLVQMRR